MASVGTPQRNLDSDKARRIVAAMRSSVGARGAAAATFDHVAQEAGVSRGLLHYYFGSKERLLAEVMRRDCEVRLARLEDALSAADSVDAIVDALVASLTEVVERERDTGQYAFLFEMFSAGRRNPEIRRELADLYRTVRGHVAEALAHKQRAGVLALRDDPEAVASVLFALGDGIALQLLSDPEWDSEAALAAGVRVARRLLGAPV